MDENDDNLPVLAEEAPEARLVERPREEMPLSAPVAAATGGVLAGLATFALARVVRHALRPKPAIRLGGRGRKGQKLEIAGSRSFLVDVHVLNKR